MRPFLVALLFIATLLFAGEPGSSKDNPFHVCYSGRLVIGSDQHPDQLFAEAFEDDGSVIYVAVSREKPFYVEPASRCADYQDPK
jgi:hypothetical protein